MMYWQRNLYGFEVNNVCADALALFGIRISAETMLTKFGPRIPTGRALKGSIHCGLVMLYGDVT